MRAVPKIAARVLSALQLMASISIERTLSGSAGPESRYCSSPDVVPDAVSRALPPKLARSASSVMIQPPFVILTVHGPGPLGCLHSENSEVLFAGSVAVAVTESVGETAGEELNVKLAFPLPSVVTLVEPRKVCPSPKPEGSQLGLEKNRAGRSYWPRC